MDNIASYIEHTNLKPIITDREVDLLVAEAKEYGFSGVCVPPFWVKRAKREIGAFPIRLVTVIGFPLGYQMTETKIDEISRAIAGGADDLDVVMNISAFKINMDWFKMAKCSKIVHEHQKMLKVIIETAYLSEQEIVRVCKIASDAGTDYIKTSTGFAHSGASVENVKLIKSSLPENVGIKASGGIKSYNMAKDLISAGASRIGTSSGIDIIHQSDHSHGTSVY